MMKAREIPGLSNPSLQLAKATNVYHVTYSPDFQIACLYFWGCNLRCRACLLKKEIYDCHLPETRKGLFDPEKVAPGRPARFLNLEELKEILGQLKLKQVIFMGAEPTVDPSMPELAEWLHDRFATQNVLLTNGLELPSLEYVDVVVFSIKAYTDSIHRSYTGKSNQKILENFVTVYRLPKKLYVETVFIPGLVDVDEIERIARFISEVDRGLPLRIDAYLPVAGSPWPRPTREQIEEAVRVAKTYLDNVTSITGSEELAYEVIRIF
ncbi:MAG: radical SAM protein [Syntrophothermus sp.]|uniref:radical SAM protein n=1 Tax=Syntrophothermus sp. TaxID=2736299 RepID=UPI00257AB194|nr:radical SAM protein [Syntrophothermus sp.]NSW83131.1 radical SAM protein [Syntrophothermus sp.]